MSEDKPKLTVTIGNTTLLVSDISGWSAGEDGAGYYTLVHKFSTHDFVEVRGDHSAALDDAVNDPRRQGLSLCTAEVP